MSLKRIAGAALLTEVREADRLQSRSLRACIGTSGWVLPLIVTITMASTPFTGATTGTSALAGWAIGAATTWTAYFGR